MLSELIKSTLPEYEITLPKSKQKVRFRPMTVKEEKVLLVNQHHGQKNHIYLGIKNIIESCFSGIKNTDSMDIIDVEKAFLHLRSKSIEENFKFGIVCPYTEENIILKTSIDNFKEIFPEKEMNKIKINDKMTLIMKYPTFSYLLERSESGEQDKELFLNCFHELQTENDSYNKETVSKNDLSEFFDHLTKKQYQQVLNFFNSIPRLENEVKYVTSDGIERTIVIKGLDSFFELASAT
jgi:hypothetical protein